jgi:predicted dehydrogenase
LVTIATPPKSHARLAAWALAAEKHVLVESPFVPTVSDAEVLVSLMKEKRHAGLMAYFMRYIPSLRLMGELLQKGQVGTPYLCRVDYFSNYLVDQPEHRRWIWDADNAGGMLAAVGSHLLDLAKSLFGGIRAVEASTHTMLPITLPDGKRVADDTGMMTAYFKNGVIGLMNYCGASAYPQSRIEVHGSEGSLVAEGSMEEVLFVPMHDAAPQQFFPPIELLQETRGKGGVLGAYNVFLSHLAGVLNDHAPATNLPTFADALDVTRLLDAIHRSAAEHKRIDL